MRLIFKSTWENEKNSIYDLSVRKNSYLVEETFFLDILSCLYVAVQELATKKAKDGARGIIFKISQQDEPKIPARRCSRISFFAHLLSPKGDPSRTAFPNFFVEKRFARDPPRNRFSTTNGPTTMPRVESRRPLRNADFSNHCEAQHSLRKLSPIMTIVVPPPTDISIAPTTIIHLTSRCKNVYMHPSLASSNAAYSSPNFSSTSFRSRQRSSLCNKNLTEKTTSTNFFPTNIGSLSVSCSFGTISVVARQLIVTNYALGD